MSKRNNNKTRLVRVFILLKDLYNDAIGVRMKKFISTLTILSCFLLAACEDKVYDVSYYNEHLEQAQDVVEKCSKGDMSGQNCENAREAIQKEQSGKAFKNMMQ